MHVPGIQKKSDDNTLFRVTCAFTTPLLSYQEMLFASPWLVSIFSGSLADLSPLAFHSTALLEMSTFTSTTLDTYVLYAKDSQIYILALNSL